ncbi:MAG: AhpC/TSA family [Candidatus Aminicenantes bacterium]|nr:AhpC/TSA family [Candidatus Aminicenantes bacterium]
MRKICPLIVLIFGLLMSLQIPAAVEVEKTVRVFRTLEEAAGRPERPLLLVFFSLECHVCWDELFEMRHFLEKNCIPVDMVGVSSDREEDLTPFLAKYGFFHPVVSDREKTLFRRFKVRQEPFRVVLDRETVVFLDDSSQDFFARRDNVKQCLLEIASR